VYFKATSSCESIPDPGIPCLLLEAHSTVELSSTISLLEVSWCFLLLVSLLLSLHLLQLLPSFCLNCFVSAELLFVLSIPFKTYQTLSYSYRTTREKVFLQTGRKFLCFTNSFLFKVVDVAYWEKTLSKYGNQ